MLVFVNVPGLQIGHRTPVMMALGRALEEDLIRHTHKASNVIGAGGAHGERIAFQASCLGVLLNGCEVGKEKGLF
jgi:hypothetical protein